MKDNEAVMIKGKKVVLTPYEAFHVPKYHKWMESEELREQTASERLTLRQECDMQAQWRNDADKCTFIILDKSLYRERPEEDEGHQSEIEAMVGDVNIFYESENRLTGEVEIMIAEPHARRKGFGREALCLMMRYGQSSLKSTKFISKISFDNRPSLKLFESLGFQEISRSDVFKEITLSLDATDPEIFYKWTPEYCIEHIKK